MVDQLQMLFFLARYRYLQIITIIYLSVTNGTMRCAK